MTDKTSQETSESPKTTIRVFSVGDLAVYPAHGVGQILAIEEQEVAGAKLELFVINFVKDKMTLRVPKEKDRADLIAYLRTLHESPPPLPAK